MDIPALTSLLSTSTSSLSALHAELGHPPEQLQQALALLAETVRSTVDAQIAGVRAQVEQVGQECNDLTARLAALKTALGAEDAPAPKGTRLEKQNQVKSGSNETLLVRRDRLAKEAQKLQSAYESRCQQVDQLLEHIQQFAPVLEGGSTADMSADAVMTESDADAEDPQVPPLPERTNVVVPGTTSDTVQDALAPAVSASQVIPIATNAYVQALNAHLNGLHALQNARAERFQAYLQHIFDLWGTLHLRPNVETDAFERSICRAAGVKPVMEAVLVEVEDEQTGEIETTEEILFRGQFQEVCEGDIQSGEDGDATVMLIMAQDDTPLLLPSVTTLRRLRHLMQGLEAEKACREERIQQLYDELFVLWSRFDCDETEMDEFVLQHKGLSLESIEAYEAELEKMLALKAQHSLIFITRIRAQMEQFCQSARLTQSECEAMWPEFFIPLPDANTAASTSPAEPSQQSAYDGLLAAHEEAIPRILALLEAKGPIMRLVERYEEVCKEEEELADSAKNTARLFAGAKKGGAAAPGAKAEKPKRDPGRLLREEKMRKRVKVLKPKLEAEMLKAIPEWEQQHGEAFMMDGERYLEKLEAAAAARRPASSIPPVSSSASLAGQKRTRQGSVGPSPGPTPSGSRVSSLVVAATPLGPSHAHNRIASSASTASRTKVAPKTPAPQSGPAAKKARTDATVGKGTASGASAPPGRAASRIGVPATSSKATLGMSVSPNLARTPAAMQAAPKASAQPLHIAKRPGPPQSQPRQPPPIALLPPSVPFQPRPSVGLPFGSAAQALSSEDEDQQQLLPFGSRITSVSSNLSIAPSNASTVIIHPVPQRSLFATMTTSPRLAPVTAPLSFKKQVVAEASSSSEDGSCAALQPIKTKRGQSRPSLSLQKALLAPPIVLPGEEGEAASMSKNGRISIGAGAAAVSGGSSMRLVSTEIARRLGGAAVGGGVASGGNAGVDDHWDHLIEEEDDLDEEDLMMPSQDTQGQGDLLAAESRHVGTLAQT